MTGTRVSTRVLALAAGLALWGTLMAPCVHGQEVGGSDGASGALAASMYAGQIHFHLSAPPWPMHLTNTNTLRGCPC